MTSRRGRHLELRPFSGSTLTDVLSYLKRDVSKAFADAFAILAKPTPYAASEVFADWDTGGATVTASQWYDSSTQLSLESGRWLVFTTGMAEGTYDSGVADTVNIMSAAIRAGDTVYTEQQIGVFGDNTATAGWIANYCVSAVSLVAVIDVGEPKVFKVSFKSQSGGGGGYGTDTLYYFNGRLTAVRL